MPVPRMRSAFLAAASAAGASSDWSYDIVFFLLYQLLLGTGEKTEIPCHSR
jgi:hypothetical protein